MFIRLCVALLGLNVLCQAQVRFNAGMFGVMEARQLGPGTMSGRITAIEGVNADEGKTLYIGTAGGGIWKSTNAGASYKSIFDKYCQSIGALAVNQKQPKIIYAGTGESNMRNSVSYGVGIYKSTDAGDNWKKIGLDSVEHISKICIHPENDNIIYVAAPGPLWSDSKHRGLYKSVNGGETWQQVFYINAATGCADIILDPKNPEHIIVSMWQFRRQPYSFNSGGPGSGLYKSIDGGKTFTEITKGLPEKPFGRIAIAMAPSDSRQMLAIVESKNTGLFRSSDGGETWQNQSASLNVCARPFYFSTLVFDPNDAQRVYRPAFQFAYSNDGGYSFSEASYDGGWVHSDMHALWINPKHTNIMYLGTDGGVYMSVDNGITWQFNHGLPVGQFYHVSYDLKTPYNIYGGLQDNGSWMAPSAAPGGIGNGNWNRVGGGDGFWTIPDADGKTVYSEYQGGNMYRVNLQNMKSEFIQPQKTSKEDKLRWNWNTPIVTGAKNPQHLYVGAQYLYVSNNQGRTWKRISGDLTTNDLKKQNQEESGGLSADNTSAENHCTIFTIAESPLDEHVIWVGTDDGNLQVSENGGTTWTNVSSAIARSGIAKQSWVSSIEPSHFNRNTVYATLENHMYGDFNTYLAVSTDLGKTWTRLSSPVFSGFAHKIKEDHVNRQLLFLGTESGLFATLDGGLNWFRMKNNIPEFALVRDLQIHPKTHDLIIGTHGRGVFILDDIRALRELNPEVWEKDFHLFTTEPLLLNNGPLGWGGPEISGAWSAGNPPAHPAITYYLKERLSTGKIEIELRDSLNRCIQTFPGTVRKGLNKIYWNLRETPPKVAAGSTKMDGAGFTAPMVLPGTYSVYIKVKDITYTGTVQCIEDTSNLDFTLTQRQRVYKSAHQLKTLFSSINSSIDSITVLQNSLKRDSVIYKKNKTAVAFYKELQNLKSKLMATTKTSIFADEERLREKVSKLYSTFCEMESAPNETQLESIEDLKMEYKKLEQERDRIITQYLPKTQLIIKPGQKASP